MPTTKLTVYVRRWHGTAEELTLEEHTPETAVAAILRAATAGDLVQVLRRDGTAVKRTPQPRRRSFGIR